ncbi:peptidase E [Candidatus Woesebacteria bacterium]|nr:peptidase E [Candidatus Woesebacteria bacterium]MCD8507772.1 peptidase E [Candidatus Woesebacteria bacterium]MCD8526959.1 peptidase E [Candidatus Woesebacteria bacterium]MCD8545870.1 peptidase E [Candidatus Woesebacteria bacterium]
MKQLFLTSSVHAVAHDLVKHIDTSVQNNLVFITTAAEPEAGTDLTWLENDRQALVDAGFTVTDYTITEKTRAQLETDLAPYDCIYMSGGNTFYLLEQAQKSGYVTLITELVAEGKTYIGTSAGSIIAGNRCPDYLLEENEIYELENQNGFGLVNFTILPHWGSRAFKEKYLSNRLEIAYQYDQVPLIILTDRQYIHVQDDHFQIIDTTARE